MAKLSLSPHILGCLHPISAEPAFGLLTMSGHRDPLEDYLRYAVQILSEHDLALPRPDQLALIVEGALAAQWHFFSSALHDPGRAELYSFFEQFVLDCVAASQEGGGR
jgi:hypothetical protein